MDKLKRKNFNNFWTYALNNNKLIFTIVALSIVSIILISTLIADPSSISSLSQALLISFIASFILYLLVETFPSYKKNVNVRTFCNETYTKINEHMASIIESLKLSANILNTETNFEKLNHVDFTKKIYYTQKSPDTEIWMYYDFCKDFKKEVDSIKKLIDRIMPLTPHLNHEEVLLLVNVSSSPLYKCIEMKIYMSQIGFPAHDKEIADNFQRFLQLYSQMRPLISVCKKYSYEIMPPEMVNTYKMNLDLLTKDKKQFLEKTEDNTDIIMKYVKSDEAWLRI